MKPSPRSNLPPRALPSALPSVLHVGVWLFFLVSVVTREHMHFTPPRPVFISGIYWQSSLSAGEREYYEDLTTTWGSLAFSWRIVEHISYFL